MAILMQNELAVGSSSMPEYTFNTVAEMNSAIQSGVVPANGALIFCKEDLPMGNTGDTSLDTTSENWVQNQAVATEVISQKETMRQNGAHNLLPLSVLNIKEINTTPGSWSGKTYTAGGVSYTLIADGDVVTGILVNGTATGGNSALWLRSGDNSGFSGMKLSGCPTSGGDDKYYIWLTGSGVTYAMDTGDGSDISTVPTAITTMAIRVLENKTVSNQTFYPMIRQASDEDKTFSPYAMTNYELTNDFLQQWTLLCSENPAANVTKTFTIPAGYRFIAFELGYFYGVISQIILPYGRIMGDTHSIIRTLSGYVDDESHLAILQIENNFNVITYTFEKQVNTNGARFRIWGIQ